MYAQSMTAEMTPDVDSWIDRPAFGTARICDVSATAANATLTLDYPWGRRRCTISGVIPDHSEASADAKLVGRPISLRIVLRSGGFLCSLQGVSARGPVAMQVSFASALALALYPLTAVLVVESSSLAL
jgi:hypothetical protein